MSAPPAAGVLRIQPSHGWTSLGLRELWAYRELLYFLTWRDVKVRYKQTALGAAWAVIQPFFTMVVFSLFFGRLAKIGSDGIPYPIFSYAALVPWTFFANGLGGSTNSLVGSANLITKVYFPRLLIPVGAVVSTLADFGISCVLLVLLMAWYRIAPGPGVVLLPLFVVQAIVLAFAIGLWASALNVRYRDVQYAMPFAMQVLLFISPVAYSAALVPAGKMRLLYALNPLVGPIQGFRWALLGASAPWPFLWSSVIVTLVLLVGGLFFFKRMEDSFADVV